MMIYRPGWTVYDGDTISDNDNISLYSSMQGAQGSKAARFRKAGQQHTEHDLPY